MTTTITQAHADKMNELRTWLEKALRARYIFAEVWISEDWQKINVDIENGDWKHEHLRVDHIVSALGGIKVAEWQTDDSEDDTYSATHQYRFA